MPSLKPTPLMQLPNSETKYEVQKKEATIARQKLILTKDGYLFLGGYGRIFNFWRCYHLADIQRLSS